jgi:hypothetical protein
MQFVHAAAVGRAAGGVILAGKGGSGKSTTALACLNAGMHYAGDDYCAVANNTPPYLHSLYNSAKLRSKADLERFPHLEQRVWNATSWDSNNGDKAIFFLSQSWSGPISAGFPLRAVLIPQINGEQQSRLDECSEAKAMLALSASTIAQLPMAGGEDLNRLGDLVAQLPRYTLYLGTDVTGIPDLIQSVL